MESGDETVLSTDHSHMLWNGLQLVMYIHVHAVAHYCFYITSYNMYVHVYMSFVVIIVCVCVLFFCKLNGMEPGQDCESEIPKFQILICHMLLNGIVCPMCTHTESLAREK